MARDEQKTISLDDRPTLGQVIVVCKQLIREDRWHRRLARLVGRIRRADWAAWWFRRRMRWALVRGASSIDVTAIVQCEVDRIAELTTRENAGVPREHQVRGKVQLPRGLFVVNQKHLTVPDSIDLVWPRSAKR